MFITDGWGARLREERERHGFNQERLTSRNTQRAYEQERNAPDLRYLADADSQGIDVHYVVTGSRSGTDAHPDLLSLMALWPSLGAENCAAILTLAKAIGTSSPKPVSSTTVRDAAIPFRPKMD